MKVTKRISSVFFACALLISGCATIMDGKTQSVTYNSIPSGADVYLNGKLLGKTPLSIQVDKPKENGQLKFVKKGYKPLTVTVNKKMDSWLLGNIIFGGTFGTSTDYASGAMYEYDPGVMQVTLEPKKLSQIELQRFEARNRVRHYVLTNYGELAADAPNPKGEYLKGLLDELKIAPQDSGKVTADLQKRLSDSGAQQFASYVIKHYM